MMGREVDGVPYRTAHRPRTVLPTRQKRSLAWALLDSQPTVSSSSSPVRDPTLDKVQTTVPCHALFGPSQSVGEVTMMAWLAGWLDGSMDGWIEGANQGDKSRGSLGSKAPDGPSPGNAGFKIGLWVLGAVGRDQDGHWSLGSRAVTSRKSCLLPPWLFCPGDGMGRAASSSRSGAAWLGARGSLAFPARLPPAVCFLLAIPWVLASETYSGTLHGQLYAHICRDKEGTACKRMYAMQSLPGFVQWWCVIYVYAKYCVPR